jgi:multiple sugar transport system substrate-binding protein
VTSPSSSWRTSFVWSNQLEELSRHTGHELGIAPYPGDPAGQWARASMYWAASAGSDHAAVVADVINFLVNDPDAAQILGAERGLAPNLGVRDRIATTLSAAMRTSVTFETTLASRFGPTPPPPPPGHGQVKTQLTQAAESVQFAKATPDEAASAFFAQVAEIVNG